MIGDEFDGECDIVGWISEFGDGSVTVATERYQIVRVVVYFGTVLAAIVFVVDTQAAWPILAAYLATMIISLKYFGTLVGKLRFVGIHQRLFGAGSAFQETLTWRYQAAAETHSSRLAFFHKVLHPPALRQKVIFAFACTVNGWLTTFRTQTHLTSSFAFGFALIKMKLASSLARNDRPVAIIAQIVTTSAFLGLTHTLSVGNKMLLAINHASRNNRLTAGPTKTKCLAFLIPFTSIFTVCFSGFSGHEFLASFREVLAYTLHYNTNSKRSKV
jgi:hypothetical protein